MKESRLARHREFADLMNAQEYTTPLRNRDEAGQIIVSGMRPTLLPADAKMELELVRRVAVERRGLNLDTQKRVVAVLPSN